MSQMSKAAVVALVAAAGLLGVTACGSNSANTGETSTAIITSGGSETMEAGNPQETNELLLLNDRLKDDLGDAYSQGWIESGQLHVAVTTEEAAKAVADAGAMPEVVQLNSQQLEAAVKSLAAWQGTLKPELAVSIHRISSDGRTGKVTIAVAEDKIPEIETALQKDDPTDNVPVVIIISSGLATPMDGTQPVKP